MTTVTLLPHHEICPEGATVEINAGENLCEALLDRAIKIEHACDMSKACTTCHVVIRKALIAWTRWMISKAIYLIVLGVLSLILDWLVSVSSPMKTW